jgi:hypothetical protein
MDTDMTFIAYDATFTTFHSATDFDECPPPPPNTVANGRRERNGSTRVFVKYTAHAVPHATSPTAASPAFILSLSLSLSLSLFYSKKTSSSSSFVQCDDDGKDDDDDVNG